MIFYIYFLSKNPQLHIKRTEHLPANSRRKLPQYCPSDGRHITSPTKAWFPDDRPDRPEKPLLHDADDRSDPNVSQNAPVIPRFNALSALRSKKLRSKMTQQIRESGDEALAQVYGTVSGKISE